MKIRMQLMTLFIILFAAACGSEQAPDTVADAPTSAVTSTAVFEVEVSSTLEPTPTKENTPTATATITPMASPTATVIPTNTPTIAPTHTPTETSTPTETATSTPVPATSTPIPPTATPAPQVPLYPNTPTVVWDLPTFLTSVTRTRDAIVLFHDYFKLIAGGQTGQCNLFWTIYATWEGAPAFTDVPPEWTAAYTEYRLVLHEIRLVADPVTQVCIKQGGSISPEIDQAILAAAEALVTRIRNLADRIGAG